MTHSQNAFVLVTAALVMVPAAACRRGPAESSGEGDAGSASPVGLHNAPLQNVPSENVPPPATPAGLPNMACTSSPCTATGTNSVKCHGSPGGVCTPTEAIVVGWDIIKGGSRISGGQLTPASCYSCLLSAGCIDGAGVKGNECGDLTGAVGAGAQSAQTKSDACLATLACILPSSGPGAGHSCASMPSTGISNCFCGAASTTAMACAGLPAFTQPGEPGQPSGTCARQEFDGFGAASGSTANMTLMRDYTKPSTASGVANAILTCAGSNTGAMASCPQCLL